MGKIITESGANFGEFAEKDLFHIEKSPIVESLGTGIKRVEFIVRSKSDIIFVEVKTGCLNPNSPDKGENFDQFYDDIADKFIDSLNVYAATVLGRYNGNDDVGANLKSVIPLKDKKIKFVLVVTASDFLEDWLQSPKLELETRLRKVRKIWGINIIVLNRNMAEKYGLIYN
ncbi:MAG: hypothetical protein Q4D51_04230 [Eubacteriales bacterium]|nr:hypothetical protein [Eubacteriales bacterium]